MIDTLLMLTLILAAIAGTGALIGWTIAQAGGAKSFSVSIIAVSIIVGVVPGGIAFAAGFLVCREIIHWGGPYRSMGVIEGLCGIALGGVCAGIVACKFSNWQHRKRHRWLTRNHG